MRLLLVRIYVVVAASLDVTFNVTNVYYDDDDVADSSCALLLLMLPRSTDTPLAACW
jgi:hypothetical protein